MRKGEMNGKNTIDYIKKEKNDEGIMAIQRGDKEIEGSR